MSQRFGYVLLAMGLMAGCNPPTSVVPVPPPGMELRRQMPPPIDGGAQALGEQPAGTGATPPMVTSKEKTPPTPVGQEITTKSGLKVTTLKPGTGAEVQPGQHVKLNYVGKLVDGKQFDANKGFELTISTGGVIKGWDEGVPGMKVGEVRRLVVPAELAYGSKANGPIPANSVLVFEIEVVETH